MKILKDIKRVAVVPLLVTGSLALFAQEDPVVDLDPYTVRAEAPSKGLLNPSSFSESGYLLSSSLNELDRSYSFLSSDWLATIQPERIEDILSGIPGAYAPARFGLVSIPNIRGGAAETFWNGQRRGDNLFGYRPSFSAVEAIEVMAGPSKLSTGPGKRMGGSVNFVMKRAQLTGNRTQITLQAGSWLPGGNSFRNASIEYDANYTMGSDSALRMVFNYRDNETFYHRNGGEDDHAELYFNYHFKPSDKLTVDIYGQVFHQSSPQLLGVNRPWQGLIDHGLYLPGGVDAQIGQPGGVPGLVPGVADPGLVTSTEADLIKIGETDTLLSTGDFGDANVYFLQAIIQKQLDPDLNYTAASFIERVDREKRNQFYYAEDVLQTTLEHRSEWSAESFGWTPLTNEKLGLQIRLEDRENYTNYWNEFAYAYDITSSRTFSAYDDFPQFIAPGGVTGPDGRPYYLPSAFFSTPETVSSKNIQIGAYYEGDVVLSDSWTLNPEFRADQYFVRSREPLQVPGQAILEDDHDFFQLSSSLSLRGKFENKEVYFTASRIRNIGGNTVGDGINLYSTGTFNKGDLNNRSDLIEAGLRWRPSDQVGTMLSIFRQERTRSEFFGSNDILAEGIEGEIEWKVNDRLSVTGSVAYLDANYQNSTPAEFGGGSINNTYAPGTGPAGGGNGIGYIGGFFLNSLPAADYEIPGISKWHVKSSVFLNIGGGFSTVFLVNWQSEQAGNLAQEFIIPDQFNADLKLIYQHNQWDVTVTFANITDETNWIHNGDTFFDQLLISRSLPRRLDLSFRYRF